VSSATISRDREGVSQRASERTNEGGERACGVDVAAFVGGEKFDDDSSLTFERF
jgi:hypothetical protein